MSYLTTSGHANRKEYLSAIYPLLFLGAVGGSLVSSSGEGATTALGIFLILGVSIAAIPPTVRRLHDLNYSSWWAVFVLVPPLNLVMISALLLLRGADGPSRQVFGPDHGRKKGGDLSERYVEIAGEEEGGEFGKTECAKDKTSTDHAENQEDSIDTSGGEIDSPRFTFEEEEVRWTCHVCSTQLRVPLRPNSKLRAECPECGTIRTVSDGIPDPPYSRRSGPQDIVFVTRATLRELRAKRQGDPDIQVRNRLVYHDEYDCAFAHKDYEVDGVLLAYNTGVVEAEYQSELSLCKVCAGVEFEPCDRCNGRGDIPKYNHVQDGICFKCEGDGYLERYPETT